MEFEVDEPITFTLDVEGGVVKSIGDRTVASYTNTDMDINVTCIYEVHGYLDGENTDPASLLVMKFDLTSQSLGRRFKAFIPTLTLRKDPKGDPEDDPWFEDLFEPGPATRCIAETFYKNTRASSFSPNVAVTAPPPGSLSAGITYTYSETKEYIKIDRYTVQGGRRKTRSQGARVGHDIIYWKAEQQKQITSGIDVMQVAFLICRKGDENFKITFELEADVDVHYKTWHRINGAKNKSSYLFRPSDPSKKIPPGVDKNFLRSLEEGDQQTFRELVFVHNMKLEKPTESYEDRE